MLWSPHGLRTPHDFAFQSKSPQLLVWCSAHQRTPHSGPLRRASLRSASTMALRTSGFAAQWAPGRRSLSQRAQAMVRSSDAGGAGGLLPVAAATSRTASCCRCGARLLRLPEQPPLPEERDSWGGPLVRELGVALWCGITTHGHGESSRRAHLQRGEVEGASDVVAAALVQDAS